jgi:hypothetical protein
LFRFPYESEYLDELAPNPALRQHNEKNDDLVRPLFMLGMTLRLLALLGLYVFDRKQQNKTGCCDILKYVLCCKPCLAAKKTGATTAATNEKAEEPSASTTNMVMLDDSDADDDADDVDWEERVDS